MDNPSLDLARQKLDNDGYTYAKKRSRSKVFSTEFCKQDNTIEKKKQKLTQELRHKRVAELKEDIVGVKRMISYLEQERMKLVNTHKYSQPAATMEKITEKRREQRKLSDELTAIQAKEAKARTYLQKKEADLSKLKKPNKTESDKRPRYYILLF